LASSRGCIELVQEAISNWHGATHSNVASALSVARKRGHEDVVQCLVSATANRQRHRDAGDRSGAGGFNGVGI
jgi:hypothetical protein